MERRELLVGGAGLAVLAGGAAFVVARRTNTADDEVTGADDENGAPEPPFERRTVDPDDGTVVVPGDGVDVLNLTRTHCPTGEGQITTLAAVDAELREDGIEDVRLLTLARTTGSPAETDAEFREWWDGTDGDWTLALDAGDTVAEHYGIDHWPTTAIVDREGSIHWRGEGTLGRGTVSARIRDLTGSADES